LNTFGTFKTLEITPIGKLHSPFKEKFGIPRQPGLIKSASASIEFFAPFNDPNAFKGLENFSHIWLTFCFHQNDNQKWRPLIRPPRLGGNEKVGVFASRSSFRPNSLGMSVVELLAVELNSGICSLEIACPDILDGTPIFDIKPYIDYSDSLKNARCGFAQHTPEAKLKIEFSDHCETVLKKLSKNYKGCLKALIEETLSYDPRPAYHQTRQDSLGREYGIRLYDLNVRWRFFKGGVVEVNSIERV